MSDRSQNNGCLGALLSLFGIGARPAQTADTRDEETLPGSVSAPLPYRVRDDFLSPAEASFYHALTSAIQGRAIICPKTGLSDIFFVARPQENRSAFNRIAQKHVDFLLCQPGTMKPLAGIELDDAASHSRADRAARDEFVERVFDAANLPLVRIPVRRSYTREYLIDRLSSVLGETDEAVSGESVSSSAVSLPSASTSSNSGRASEMDSTDAPLCPKCGVSMVLRKATQGERVGQEFYGCSNYPRCRQTQPII